MKLPRVSLQVLFLASLVLVLFYPTVRAPLNPMDDRAIVQWLLTTEGQGVSGLFAHSMGNYYRPVLLVTYYFDMAFWGADPSVMHLENLLLHVTNVLLLFGCARIVCKRLLLQGDWLPFLAALLFAIHPVNTEAVNWIAGRSDLLACFFVQLSALLLLLGIFKNRPLYAYLSILPLVPGFFSKETAVFFGPAALVIILSDNGLYRPAKSRFTERIKHRLPFLVPYLAIPILYLVLRGRALFSGDAGFSLVRNFLSDRNVDLMASAKTSLIGLGFYGKKLIFPWPLNFTIFQVPDYYSWVGILVLAIGVYCVCRGDLLGGLGLASFCLVISAIIAMLLRPGWTPVAERYLYIPSTFFCVSAVLAGHWLLSRVTFPRLVPLIVALFFSSTALATIDRTLIWQDNISLFQDAVRKSPDFPFARSVLADLLLEAGRVEEGKAMIWENTAPEGLRNADFLDLKRAQLLFIEGKDEESRAMIIEKRRRNGQLFHTFQKLLAKVDNSLLEKRSGLQRQEIYKENIAVYLELFQAYQDPFYYYQLGKMYMQAQDRENAARYFLLASEGAPERAHYKAAAAKLAETMAKP